MLKKHNQLDLPHFVGQECYNSIGNVMHNIEPDYVGVPMSLVPRSKINYHEYWNPQAFQKAMNGGSFVE